MLEAKEKGEDFNKEETEKSKTRTQGEMVATDHPPNRARTPFRCISTGPGVKSQARLKSSGVQTTPRQWELKGTVKYHLKILNDTLDWESGALVSRSDPAMWAFEKGFNQNGEISQLSKHSQRWPVDTGLRDFLLKQVWLALPILIKKVHTQLPPDPSWLWQVNILQRECPRERTSNRRW